ncbi:class I SAM-dependent methyltransferase [Colwellia sp. TT2012]|uniref:class I SAM-dependent methyltransferase n=1 Tax=Colwellia sp. TT2012 TaxID=1720342 RepID=UPI0007089169|nr:class I SAM-dependent methyltransferase [Colwellia sp. TT2012]
MFNKEYYKNYSSIFNSSKLRKKFSPQIKYLKKTIITLPDNALSLDVGCGVGSLLSLQENLRPDLKTVGLDIGEPPYQLFKGSLIKADCINIPLRENSFDLISACHLIEHLQKPSELITELVRVTKKGGVIYFEAPSQNSTNSLLPFSFWDDPSHIRPYSPLSLKNLAEMHGLTVVKFGIKRSFLSVMMLLPVLFINMFIKNKINTNVYWSYVFGANSYCICRK